MLKIFNTLSRSTEDFRPINSPQVGMYTCGPTVYDYMHIGNLRTFVFSDILRRVLAHNGYSVKSVQNITDIDDKIIKRAQEKNVSTEEISKQYTTLFLQDIKKLNILPQDVQPKATEYIDKMVDYILVLLEKGIAYKEQDGSVYFDISKFQGYGKLARIQKDSLKTGTRILSDEYSKDDVQDFALWKAVSEGGLGSYESKLGHGRPGWHIECSVMSQEILGDTFDIHAGGIDLIFPHHENEIAQSEAKTSQKFVNFFLHGAHMLVDGKKMSKSLGNFYTLSDLEKKNIDPLALRYVYLQTHYRQEMNFTFQALEGAASALKKLQTHAMELGNPSSENKEFMDKFQEALNDDLNMPQALAVVWEMVKSDISNSEKAATLQKMDEVLGLNLIQSSKLKVKSEEIPQDIQSLAQERQKLRQEKKFDEADKVRVKIEQQGYKVEDTDSGALKISKL